MLLTGHTALITGASRGIGQAVAVAMAREGAQVVVNYFRDAAGAETTLDKVRRAGSDGVAVKADVRDLGKVQEMIKTATEKVGNIDILVNNAGLLRDNLVSFMSDEEWSEVIDVNLKGTFHCVKACSRIMARKRWGRIINISSDAGLMGDVMRVNYAAAKAGVLGLTRALARELAASGITVNAVAPGIIETAMIAGMNERKREAQLNMIPQKRFGAPEDVAETVVFLASERAEYITGQVICVDGGLCM